MGLAPQPVVHTSVEGVGIADWVEEGDTSQAPALDAVKYSGRDGWAEVDPRKKKLAACQHDGSPGYLADILESEARTAA